VNVSHVQIGIPHHAPDPHTQRPKERDIKRMTHYT
jgi:hypothetical protein